MTETKSKKGFNEDEKALVEYLKNKLKEANVLKFPQDWHLKQLSTARRMLAGENAPSLSEWMACIDWAYLNPYWKDKVDHLARIMSLWPKFRLQGGENIGISSQYNKNSIQRGSYGNRGERYANEGPLPF
ncbi:hypothetical protein [Desulforamulus ruminis]|uniref:Uncharacterized protein n=1 Tax=Desulforamulus ruminis (strain ATCC 23193 / DSM 2154 / NCIMB 8452 / DL) TaxID=696281 RepID=F6DTH7_DESRL|nr:hypothetical protein [Desulforamulus ruminis]AEG60039.1 hypothetical protein Desru_1776 [Desulforamulus ruminis DSM 2154]